MSPVRNRKFMEKMITKGVEFTSHHKQPLMKKVFCF